MNSKSIMITGAGGGIGRAVAIEAATRYQSLLLIDKNEAGLAATRRIIERNAANATVLCVAADITNKKLLKEKINNAKQVIGTIDVLVNVAGVAPGTSLEQISEEEWDFVMDINLKGMFFCIQVLLDDMLKKKSGCILNFSSMAGIEGSANAGIHYCTSKAGVIGLTKYISKVYASQGIRCNAIAPGPVKTEMTKLLGQETLDRLLDSMPMRKLAEPEEIAKACMFLCSEDASYVTGSVFEISGGQIIV